MEKSAPSSVYLAVDLGAGSGRVIAGILEGDSLRLEELHRFANDGVRLVDTRHWNVTDQFTGIRKGLAVASERYGDRVRSIGVDTWGLDYGLIDAAGSLLGLPVQYWDSRNNGMMEKAFERMPARELYAATGNQFLPFNTVFQLLAEAERHPGRLGAADRFLMMADLFNYWLTGRIANEATNASTTQLVNAATGEWALDVIDRLQLPRALFREILPPGTVLGELLPWISKETGLTARVVAVGGHDTASAYAAVPSLESNSVYVSSGTWSLLGTLTPEAIINKDGFDLAFANERAIGGEIRLLKNICGMWLIQECKRVWDQTEEVSWETLIAEAEAAPPFVSLIDPDDSRLAEVCDMPARLSEVCASLGQPVPASRGAFSRMIFESLALKYRVVFDKLERLVGHELGTFHIVGGGCQNRLLNQFTADALGHEVVTGPVEATAIGNILSQLRADGKLASHAAGSHLVRRSFEVETFTPRETGPETDSWADALQRFETLIQRSL